MKDEKIRRYQWIKFDEWKETLRGTDTGQAIISSNSHEQLVQLFKRVTGLTCDRDELFYDAATLVVKTQNVSASKLQIKFKIGYNRAERILEQLQSAGIIAPVPEPYYKKREVLVKNLADFICQLHWPEILK